MTEAIERSQRKLAPSESGRVMCAKSVLAVALAFGLGSCALLSRDGSENGQQIAAQIKAGDVEVVGQERLSSNNRGGNTDTIELGRGKVCVFRIILQWFKTGSWFYEIAVSDIDQNEGAYSNPLWRWSFYWRGRFGETTLLQVFR